ncbi:unnamed protein product [Moneuplotes crassus]|uniref:Uncharacterized protein n=1 Tax=Euplotes crassus TaxID=5936 RepID=A0AAD1UKN9_EUPCR|nr:unnamed protein product [Moneuplotes crassus]
MSEIEGNQPSKGQTQNDLEVIDVKENDSFHVNLDDIFTPTAEESDKTVVEIPANEVVIEEKSEIEVSETVPLDSVQIPSQAESQEIPCPIEDMQSINGNSQAESIEPAKIDTEVIKVQGTVFNQTDCNKVYESERVDLTEDVSEIDEPPQITPRVNPSKILNNKENTLNSICIPTDPLTLEERDSCINNTQTKDIEMTGNTCISQKSGRNKSLNNEKQDTSDITEQMRDLNIDPTKYSQDHISNLCESFSQKMDLDLGRLDYLPKILKFQAFAIDFTKKSHIVQEFCKRWWYVLPVWPPINYDYTPLLRKNNLRLVQKEYWMETPDYNGKDIKEKKVFEDPHNRGIFEDSEGLLYDLRPHENCPSISNFAKTDSIKLMNLLCEAYKCQIHELENIDPYMIQDIEFHNQKLVLYNYLREKLISHINEPPVEFLEE